MLKKQYGRLEKQRILLRGESGKQSIRQLCLRQGIPEQTYYRWRREALAGPTLFALRLRAAKVPLVAPNVDEDDDSVTGVHLSLIPDPPPVESGTWRDDACPDDLLEADLQAQPQPPQQQPPQRLLTPRGRFAVEIHGTLSRGAYTFMPLALPDDLREQLGRETRGSLNQTIVGLARYALEALEREGQALHLYNLADGLPPALSPSARASKSS